MALIFICFDISLVQTLWLGSWMPGLDMGRVALKEKIQETRAAQEE